MSILYLVQVYSIHDSQGSGKRSNRGSKYNELYDNKRTWKLQCKVYVNVQVLIKQVKYHDKWRRKKLYWQKWMLSFKNCFESKLEFINQCLWGSNGVCPISSQKKKCLLCELLHAFVKLIWQQTSMKMLFVDHGLQRSRRDQYGGSKTQKTCEIISSVERKDEISWIW